MLLLLFLILTAAEHAPSAAAEKVEQITQAQIGAGVAAHGKATEIPRLLAIGCAAVLNLIEHLHVFHVVRFHAHRFADMLQGSDLVAQAVVGNGAEVIPPGVALRAAAQGIQRLPEPAETDILESCLLVLVFLG